MNRISQFLRDLDLVNTAVRYNPLFVRRLRRCVAGYETATPDARQILRRELMQNSLRNARSTPYGKAFGNELADWPVLNKEQVRTRPRDFLRGGRIRIAASTGGTTGTPLSLYRSLGSIAIERHFIERLLRKHQLDLRQSKVAILGADEVKPMDEHDPPFGVYSNGGRTLVLSNAHLNNRNLQWFADELRQFEPSILYVYPSTLENFLALLAGSDDRLSIPVVLSSSEMCNSALFGNVGELLGGQLIDYYGQGERVAFASAREPDEYYFEPLYGKVELLPPTGSEPVNGAVLCKVIASSYWNPVMPLIRYDTGDYALIDVAHRDRLEEIANGELPFFGIKGRQSEYLLGPDGEVVVGLNHLPRNVGGLVRMQLVQDSLTEVRMRILVDEHYDAAAERVLLDNAAALLPSAIDFKLERNATMERASNGKIPFVIRRLEAAQDE